MDFNSNLNKFNKTLFDFYFGKEHVAFQKTFDCTVLKKFTNVGKNSLQPSVSENDCFMDTKRYRTGSGLVYSKVNNRNSST